MIYTYKTRSEAETYDLGIRLAKVLTDDGKRDPKKTFITLSGELGIGKSVFARGFINGLIPGSKVRSPSYTIVYEYHSEKYNIYHFDFYRLESSEDLFDIGFEEYVKSGICIAEWCEKVIDAIPEDSVNISIEYVRGGARKVKSDYEF